MEQDLHALLFAVDLLKQACANYHPVAILLVELEDIIMSVGHEIAARHPFFQCFNEEINRAFKDNDDFPLKSNQMVYFIPPP